MPRTSCAGVRTGTGTREAVRNAQCDPWAPGTRPPQQENNERQELQKAIEEAGNDRAALVKNLEGFLNKYPETSQRPQIYRALVESTSNCETSLARWIIPSGWCR